MQNFDAPSLPNSNQVISNRYRLQQFLGRGAFGQVFAAEDTKFSPPKRVAIKIINPEFINEPVVREDVRREAGVMARFNHPHILRVLDFEVNQSSAYIVTDLAEGGSLSSRIQPDPTKPPVQMPLPEVANLLEQIGSALDEAHLQGLVHRDIKPHNILMDSWGRPLLADFGLATTLNGSQRSVMVMATTSGTPPYMAPEQWTGQAGKASDIYALGVLAYQLITGKTPFQGNQFELMGQHLNTPVPPLSFNAPGLKYPPQLDQIIAEAMAKNPHNRIKSALELARRFKAALQTGPTQLPVPAPVPLAATEIAIKVNLPPQVTPPTPAQLSQVVDPLRAQTQIVALPAYQKPPANSGGAVPNYNQSVYAPQPPVNQAYNPAYPPQVPVRYPNPAVPRKKNNNNTMILIGGGIALALVLVVIVVVVSTNNNGGNGGGTTTGTGQNGGSNARSVSSRTSLSLYPNAVPLNVAGAFKQNRLDAYNQSFGNQQSAHDTQYFASPDSMDQIAQFYQNDAQSKGRIQANGYLNDGTYEIVFVDGRTNDLVVINIIPPQVAQSVGFTTGTNNVIEIID
jgi:eukaryotic-like serine/threonine-protein kinase